jgi:hypothetical protein
MAVVIAAAYFRVGFFERNQAINLLSGNAVSAVAAMARKHDRSLRNQILFFGPVEISGHRIREGAV